MIEKTQNKENVVAIVKDINGKIKSINKCKNIVTDAGDLFYAQKGCGATPHKCFC